MKELSIEDKAKRYDEAIKYGQYLINERCKEGTDGSFHRADLDKMFPELAESEDERIRTRLIDYFSGFYDRFATDRNHTNVRWEGLEVKKVLAWLEKQGEQKPAWSEEDEEMLSRCIRVIACCKNGNYPKIDDTELNWLKSLKDRAFPQQQVWSEEDEKMLNAAISFVKHSAFTTIGKGKNATVDWLKSLRPQSTWKPSEEMLEALYRVTPENVKEKSEDEILLDKLYQGLKYGRVLSKN